LGDCLVLGGHATCRSGSGHCLLLHSAIDIWLVVLNALESRQGVTSYGG
jgi:hypothetical protein